MLPRNIPSSSPAPADPLAGPAVPPDRDPLLIPAAPVLAADSEEFPEPWEPAAEPNLIRRWLKGWRLVIVLAVLALGYLKWRGGHDYAHFKGWRAWGIAAEAMVRCLDGLPGRSSDLIKTLEAVLQLSPQSDQAP